MTDFSCPDCKDTGLYQGLFAVEPCRACGGKKGTESTLFGKPVVEVPSMEPTPSMVHGKARYVADACQQFAIPPCELKADTTEFERGLERAKKSVEAFEVLRSGGQSISHELQEQATEEWPRPFDEIMPAELEGIAPGRLLQVSVTCGNIGRVFDVCNKVIDRPLFGLPRRTMRLVEVNLVPHRDSAKCVLAVGRFGEAHEAPYNAGGKSFRVQVYELDPCSDMLFIPMLED